MILGFKSEYLHKCISTYADKLIRQALCSCYTVRWLTANLLVLKIVCFCVVYGSEPTTCAGYTNATFVSVCNMDASMQEKIAVHAVSLATVGSEGWHNLWRTPSPVVSRSSPSPVLQYVKATGRHQAIKNWTWERFGDKGSERKCLRSQAMAHHF